MSVEDKLINIFDIINDVKDEDPVIASILIESFGIALDIIKLAGSREGRQEVDISEYLQIISNVLGVSLEDMVLEILQSIQQGEGSNKAPDQKTLEFITSDLDDYEKFLAQNKAKEDLEFLSKTL